MQYNLKRAIRANLIFLWIFSVLLTLTAYINGGIDYGISAAIATLSTSVITTILFFLPIPIHIKGEIIVIIPLLAALGLSIQSGGVARMFNIYMVAFAMQALYFSFKKLMIFGGMVNALLILLYLIQPSLILNPGMGLGEFIPRIGAMICLWLVLSLLNKWGGHTVQSSEQQRLAIENNLQQLNTLFNEIQTASNQLSTLTHSCSGKISESSVSNAAITETVSDLSKSVEEAAITVSNINISAEASGRNIKTTHASMTRLMTIFTTLKEDVSKSLVAVTTMGSAIQTLDHSASESTTTLSTLSGHMQHITQYLDGIKSIAEQTNLLSLNASIEAARAGEHGKGFAVVADEIRKLSIESNTFAEDIATIVKQLMAASDTALALSKSGQVAMSDGRSAMDSLNHHFDAVSIQLNEVDTELIQEAEAIGAIHVAYQKIEQDIMEIAAILEENASQFEAIASKIEIQNVLVHEVNDEVHQIETIGDGLLVTVSNS